MPRSTQIIALAAVTALALAGLLVGSLFAHALA